ncbi:mecC-type methicillin resistance repressor MecI [Staphylococcus caeli]|uniref:Methicillin resistance regulatory protein MecI n=1 Tax=Staphylococcus caeli TaxID=2201815 RepID=A0A1D4NPC1_9STAP|nr:mecC-type methicillin resistance repressor MecI [Staphylococcus caeli]AWM30255.1 methicillin resistance repressor MecI [Staphylococcus caeli]SCT12526.1 methicillin resistance regulatory protein MecI [Staphylococcus caeli]SCT51168.1 methicillin resistance regulatory protein MecI [Staphylococcus caeli]
MTHEGYDISASEWEIMNTIWNEKLISANDVIEIVQQRKEWSPKTIRTLINRLYKKKFIDRTRRNKIFEYFPIVEEKDMKYKTSKVFLDKVYEGGLNSLVLNFVENEELSEDDIEELKNILNKKKD